MIDGRPSSGAAAAVAAGCRPRLKSRIRDGVVLGLGDGHLRLRLRDAVDVIRLSTGPV